MASDKNSWRSLAEMFGLPVEKPTHSPPAVEPLASQSTVSPTRGIDGDKAESDALASVKAETPNEPFGAYEEVVIEADDDTVLAADSESGGMPGDDASRVSGEARDDKGRRRRRRRGRRGRRDDDGTGESASSGRTEDSQDADDEVESVSADAESDDDGHERSGRGRDEDRDLLDDEDDRREVRADHDDEDEFSKDAWADWNVPSWQELIDSLYRPDR